MLTVLCGPAQSGKTARLLAHYRATLVQQPLGSALWLAPTWRAAAEVRLRLFDEEFGGCFSPGVMTFETFAETVLRSSGLPIRPITRLMKRELVRQIMGEQTSRGRLKHFQSIAATSGLVDLVCEFISELKRLEIWPEEFQRACSTRGISDKDVELSEIYEAYQQALREHGLFDAEGRFWSARDVLQKAEGGGRRAEDVAERGLGGSPPSEAISVHHSSFIIHHLQLVVVDGFADFTRTQHEIIEILAKLAETTIVTLPLESEPRRTDLFAKPLKTLAELRRRHPDLAIEETVRPMRTDWPAMGHLERTLFVNPREQWRVESGAWRVEDGGRGGTASESVPSPAPGIPCSLSPTSDLLPTLHSPLSTLHSPLSTLHSPAGIEILAAARQVGETELIGATIKRLLVDGKATPGEIAVVFRSPQEIGGLVSEVFGRLGVPVVFESGQSLNRSPALRALATLLQLDLDDWPFDQLLAVLGSNYFQPDEHEGQTVAEVERTVRGLQIPYGRDRLLGQLRSSSKKSQSVADRDATTGRGFVSDERALTIVQHLAKLLDALPERATLPDWAKAWQQLARETGLLRAIDASSIHHSSFIIHHSLSDLRAWNRLIEVLEAGDTLAAWLKRRPPELDRRAAFEALLDILRSECVGHAGDEAGYVRVLSASSVRSLRIPYLFLAGLSEKVFPPPDREDRLYSEAEYVRLIDAGLPFVARTERTREEMLLFYEAITRATKRLYLSYPALDDSAQPLLPSPFLREVEQAFGGGVESGEWRVESKGGFGRIPRIERADLSPIPPDDEPLSEAEFRVKALATALAGNVALLAGLFRRAEGGGQKAEGGVDELGSREIPLALAAGLEMIHLRQDRDRFGPAEGVMPGQAAHFYLATRYPQQHTFSATELERYASCPFRFFLERVLKIEPVDDLALEFDVLNRGRVVHNVLATFHRRVNERLGRPASPLELDAADFDTMLAAAIAESLPPEPENPIQAALGEIDHRLVVDWLSNYRTQFEKYGALWQNLDRSMAPELFEVSFGRADEPSPSTDKALEFSFDGQTVRISGRVDRIDTGEVAGEMVFNVLDYKTGGTIAFTAETIRAGTTLQLPIYALAAVELLFADRDTIPWQAGYWYVRENGFRPRQARKMYRNDDGRIELESEWEDTRSGLAETVIGLVRGIRRGQFPVCSTDERCTGHCPFNTVCRINQVRSLEKICQPTATV